MKRKDLSKLKEKSKNELLKLSGNQKIELIKTVGNLKANKEKDLKKASKLKRDLAQVLTIIREKEIIDEKRESTGKPKEESKKTKRIKNSKGEL